MLPSAPVPPAATAALSQTEHSFTMRSHKNPVLSLAFGVNNGKLASADKEQLIIWDTTTWRSLTVLSGSKQIGASSVAWDPHDNHRVATVSKLDRMLRLWDLRSRQQEMVPIDRVDNCNVIAWRSDGHSVALKGETQVSVLDVRKLPLPSNKSNWTTKKFDHVLNDCCFFNAAADRPLLAVATSTGNVDFLDANTLELHQSVRVHPHQALCVREYRNILCTGGDDAMVYAWQKDRDLELDCFFSLDSLNSRAKSISIGSAGKWLAACSDKTIELMNLENGSKSSITALPEEVLMLSLDSEAISPKLAFCVQGSADVFVHVIAQPQ